MCTCSSSSTGALLETGSLHWWRRPLLWQYFPSAAPSHGHSNLTRAVPFPLPWQRNLPARASVPSQAEVLKLCLYNWWGHRAPWQQLVSCVNGPKGGLFLLQLLPAQQWHTFPLPPFPPAPSPHFSRRSAEALIYCVSRHCDDEIYCEKSLKISSENSKMDFTYFPVMVVHDLSHLGWG